MIFLQFTELIKKKHKKLGFWMFLLQVETGCEDDVSLEKFDRFRKFVFQIRVTDVLGSLE
jgi:hypothetical protein